MEKMSWYLLLMLNVLDFSVCAPGQPAGPARRAGPARETLNTTHKRLFSEV